MNNYYFLATKVFHLFSNSQHTLNLICTLLLLSRLTVVSHVAKENSPYNDYRKSRSFTHRVGMKNTKNKAYLSTPFYCFTVIICITLSAISVCNLISIYLI